MKTKWEIKARKRRTAKEWYLKNKAKKLAYMKIYYIEHKKEFLERSKKWKKKNKHRFRILCREGQRRRLNIKPENYRK